MNPTKEQVIQWAKAAGAVEMRENCLNAEAFPWGCEMEIDHLLSFYAAARAQALDEAASAHIASHGFDRHGTAQWLQALKGKQ